MRAECLFIYFILHSRSWNLNESLVNFNSSQRDKQNVRPDEIGARESCINHVSMISLRGAALLLLRTNDKP